MKERKKVMSKKLMASVLIASYCLNSFPVVAGPNGLQEDSHLSDNKRWKNRSIPQQVWRGVQHLLSSPQYAVMSLLMLSSRFYQTEAAPTDVSVGNHATALGHTGQFVVNSTTALSFVSSTEYQDSTETTTSYDLAYRGSALNQTTLEKYFNYEEASFSLISLIPQIIRQDSGVFSASYGAVGINQAKFQQIQKRTDNFFAASVAPSGTNGIYLSDLGGVNVYDLGSREEQAELLTRAKQATEKKLSNFFDSQKFQNITLHLNAQYAYIDLQPDIRFNEATRMFDVSVIGKSWTDQNGYTQWCSQIDGPHFFVAFDPAKTQTTVAMKNGTQSVLLRTLAGDQLDRMVELHLFFMETIARSNNTSPNVIEIGGTSHTQAPYTVDTTTTTAPIVKNARAISSTTIANIIKGAGIATLIGIAAVAAYYKGLFGKKEKTAAVELQPLSAAI
jgi:hypothetical protein